MPIKPKSSTVIDVERLRTVLEHITANPELHNQAVWGRRWSRSGGACDTAHCVAGWAVEFDKRFDIRWRNDNLMPTLAVAEYATDESGHEHHIRQLAQDLFGFTRSQANVFFDSTNSLYRLWGYASTWTDGLIQRPDHVTPAGLRP